jgi:hypothetical protein
MAAAFSSSTATARMTVEGAPAWDLATLMPDGAVGASASGGRAVVLAQAFADSYLELLAAGGSRSPQRLGEIVGVDLSDPGFWATGMELIDRNLDEARDVASAMAA